MKILVIVRHGSYGSDDRLNETGREQMTDMAEKLKLVVESMSVLILSSTEVRASEGAQIISNTLSVLPELHELLWSERRHPEDYPGLLEMIRARQEEAECIILMTHLEYANGFAAFFARHELGGLEVPYIGVSKGEGVILDKVQRTLMKIK